MKRILFLATLVVCLSSAAAARLEPLPPCGTASFAASPSIRAGVSSSGNNLQAVTTGDLNNDGRPDLVTANSSSNTVSVLLASGQGYAPAVNFSAGGAIRPFSVAVADFNEDGKADVVTANVTSENLSLFLGDGAGGLAAPTQLQGGSDPIYVVTGDFNADGNVDLAVANSDTASVSIRLGNGAGGFAPLSSFAVGTNPRALVVADFNLDGKSDLAVANRGSFNVSVLLGDGAGGFAPLPAFLSGVDPGYLAAADFNSDGKTDLVVANQFVVSVFTGSGDGGFSSVINTPVGSILNSVTVGDFNLDGNADWAAGTNAAGVIVRLGDGAGNFGALRTFRAALGPLYLLVTDFNLDGRDDIIAASQQADTINPLAGDGAGNFTITPSLTTGTNVISHALADFNGDGKLDAALANENINNDSVSVRLGTGTGTFGAATNFAVGRRPFSVSAGDLNNDNKPDLVTANNLEQTVSVLLGDGAGSFAAAVNITTPSGGSPFFVTISDVNRDNKADLLVLRTSSRDVTVMLGDGAGGFTSQNSFLTDFNPRRVAVGDFNNDGKVDLAVTDSSFSILLGDGAGNFGPPATTNFGSPTGPTDIVARDFNDDGKLDLAIVNEIENNVSVLLGDGTGGFAPRVNYRPGIRPSSLDAADMNGDGLLDLVVGNFVSQSVSVLQGDGAGAFGAANSWGVPTSPYDVALGDLNNDGRPDITAVGNNTLASLVNTCGDAPAPPDARLTVDDVTIAEPDAGTAGAVFTVSLSTPSAQTVTTRYYVGAASAERNDDFQPVSGTLTFAPGVTSQTVTVPVAGDTIDEFDERFSLNLYDPTNALIVDRTGAGTIADNDLEPSISIADVSVPEGVSNSNLAVTVRLSQVSGKTVTLAFATADGTATAGSDYTAASGTLSIPADAASGTINIQLIGDSVNEPNETFAINLSSPVNASLATTQATVTIVNDDTPTLQFLSPVTVANEGLDRSFFVTVTRTGDTSGEAFVSYATTDNTASERKDYTAALGRLRFAPGQTTKSFQVVITDDRFDEDTETFNLVLSNPTGAVIGTNATSLAHISDNDAANGPSPVRDASFDTEFFVRQHYADFLNRVPDAGGLAFWMSNIDSCGNNQSCREVRKVDTSAAFFLSIEFQETGFLAYRTHKAAFGDLPGKPVPLTLRSFLADSRQIGDGVIVGTPGWPVQLEANKVAYFSEVVTRPAFIAVNALSLTAEQYVGGLFSRAGVQPTQAERSAAVTAFGAGGTAGRAAALRSVAESQTLKAAETNKAFVLMQYFGYLRRNPDDTDFQNNPDPQFLGYNFWLTKLNQFNGNYVDAEMVKAFIQSIEYGDRFGQ